MTYTENNSVPANDLSARLSDLGDRVTSVGLHALRFSSATVLGWIGAP
jgi:hypothetical protein